MRLDRDAIAFPKLDDTQIAALARFATLRTVQSGETSARPAIAHSKIRLSALSSRSPIVSSGCTTSPSSEIKKAKRESSSRSRLNLRASTVSSFIDDGLGDDEEVLARNHT